MNKQLGEPTHMRLYYIKKEKKQKPEEKVMEVVDELEEKMINGKKVMVTKKVKKLVVKKSPPKVKIDKTQSEQHIFSLYQDGFRKQERMQELTKKVISEEKHEVGGAIEMSNKVVLKRFIKQYKDSLHMVVTSDRPNKLNLIQLNTLFEILKMISSPDSKDDYVIKEHKTNQPSSTNKDELIQIKEVPILNESTIKQQEKKLVCTIWENLKDDDGLVTSDHIFLFLIAVLNIYEFYLYDSYKHDHGFSGKQEEKKDNKGKSVKFDTKSDGKLLTEGDVVDYNNTDANNPIALMHKELSKGTLKKPKGMKDEKTAKELEKEKIMTLITNDMNSKIKISKKYCSFDENKGFMLSLQNAKVINQDFNLFYVNWSTNNYLALKSVYHDEAVAHNNPGVYKPKINANSAKLFTEFRKKLQHDTSGNH